MSTPAIRNSDVTERRKLQGGEEGLKNPEPSWPVFSA
jgi:hypothetical protein